MDQMKMKTAMNEYIKTMKNDICKETCKLELNNDPKVVQLIRFICDYEPFVLTSEWCEKPTRKKIPVIPLKRCCANRSSGEQCTRQRKGEEIFCGTHLKGTPHGFQVQEQKTGQKQVDIWTQDIQGIIYYIDTIGNIYLTEDIMTNCANPRIIGKYNKLNGVYSFA